MPPAGDGEVGVLVMAHGGGKEWNSQVADAVAPLAADVPTALAFGMADPSTLAAALDSLRDRGVSRAAVVRMFLSGESFAQQTRFYLGLAEDPPEEFVLMGPRRDDPAARLPIRHDLTVATHHQGLLASAEARHIVTERAATLSVQPTNESVLLIAHGMGAEDENDRVREAMQSAADSIGRLGFAKVGIATLREDWRDEREAAEAFIRRFVAEEGASGRTVIVVPMRLSGFGPYAEVLAGLSYLEGEGLLPHSEIADWVRHTASRVACGAGWGPALGPCDAAVADSDSSSSGNGPTSFTGIGDLTRR